MGNKVLGSNWTALLAVIVIIVGFNWVTQAGQGFAPQNDGYAGSGGFLILVGGIVLGFYLAVKGNTKNGKGKSSK